MGAMIGGRIEREAAGIIGRAIERAVLRPLLFEDAPLVVFVHGIGGVGKSALLAAFCAEARAADATVLRLDGGSIEPTEPGFLTALAATAGTEASALEELSARLNGLGGRVIVVVDSCELLRPIDPWLRQTLVPGLTDTVRLVLAGREPPLVGWRAAFGDLFRSLPLRNLPADEAFLLLRHAGISDADAHRINRLARGHPLSLRLAAAALAEGPQAAEASTMNAMVEGLTEVYLARLDPRCRVALEAAAVVRRPTLSLLAAMLPEAAPQDAFERLRTLPFVEIAPDGLILHDTVREVVAAYLRGSDPDRAGRTASPPGGSCATRCRVPPGQRCGATPPTCSTCSRTRSSARRSSRRRSIATSSTRRSPKTEPRSCRSPPTTSRPRRHRSLRSGGSDSRTAFELRATPRALWSVSTWSLSCAS